MQAHRHQHRHSVITSASAAEVALAQAVRTNFEGIGWAERDVTELLKGASGIVDLYRLVAAERQLPVSVMQVRDQLAAPRNRGAHGGESPTGGVVRSAIRTARELLSVSPLPVPESFL